MGLNREVRDFFTNRINGVLNKKLETVREPVDADKVESEVVKMFCEEYGLEDVPARWGKMKEQKNQADLKEKVLKRKISEVFVDNGWAQGGSRNYCYCPSQDMDAIVRKALLLFKDTAMVKLYPNVVPEVEKIEAMKQNVHASVLLATTERKLVALLTELLENYGGDMKELTELLPKLD